MYKKKEVELPSVGLQASLLLSCFLFTLSYGAGYFSLKRNNGAGFIKKVSFIKKMLSRNGGGDLRYARWDTFKGSSKFMMIHIEVQV